VRELEEIRQILAQRREELRHRFRVKHLALFGSRVRGEGQEESDLDILVEFEGPVGWEVVDLHRYLAPLPGGSVGDVGGSGHKGGPHPQTPVVAGHSGGVGGCLGGMCAYTFWTSWKPSPRWSGTPRVFLWSSSWPMRWLWMR
jgi:predicted nucleotidyltransferase